LKHPLCILEGDLVVDNEYTEQGRQYIGLLGQVLGLGNNE